MTSVYSKQYLDCTTFNEFVNSNFDIPQLLKYDGLTTEQLNQWSKFPENADVDPWFEYCNNTAGFRDSNISETVDICYYGCSFTYGTGVPVEKRWTNVLDQLGGFTSNNFAGSGFSCEDMMYLFMASASVISMNKAVFVFPDYFRYRFPIKVNNEVKYWMLDAEYSDVWQNVSEYQHAGDTIYQLADEFWYDRFRKTVQTICHIAKLKNIDVYFSTWSTDIYNQLVNDIKYYSNATPLPKFIIDHRSRDSMKVNDGHSGVNPHKLFANQCLDAIKSINDL